MSSVLQPPLSRRQLLQSGLALAGVWMLPPRSTLARELPKKPPCDPDCTRWALLSDTHIAADPEDRYHGFYPYRNLREAIAQISYHLPEGVVIAGDLARLRGKPEDYNNFKTLLTPLAARPIYLGLGNHDDRDGFFRTFAGTCDDFGAVADKHVIVAQAGPVRMIVLDTLLRVNGIVGKLGDLQRTWLQTALQACDDKPTILFLHHSPKSDLLDRRRLLEIIKPESKIKAVVYGHSHGYEYSEIAGIHLINVPSTGYPMWSGQPVGWMEAKLTARGGTFTLHTLDGDRRRDGQTQTLLWRT